MYAIEVAQHATSRGSYVPAIVAVAFMAAVGAFAIRQKRQKRARWDAYMRTVGLTAHEQQTSRGRVLSATGTLDGLQVECRSEYAVTVKAGRNANVTTRWTRFSVRFPNPMGIDLLVAEGRMRQLLASPLGVMAFEKLGGRELGVSLEGTPVVTDDAAFDRDVYVAARDLAVARRAFDEPCRHAVQALLALNPRAFVTDLGVHVSVEDFVPDPTRIVPAMLAVASRIATLSVAV